MLQKTIWSLWYQGWDNAPPLVRACAASWAIHNPDWTIHQLTRETIGDYINGSTEFNEMCDRKDTLDVLSDIIRNELLTRYGGIWADSTTYCLRPLDQWIGYATSRGFFAFNRPFPDIMLSNWFLASENNYIPQIWLERSYAYWKGRTQRDPYFWHHKLFADAYQEDAEFRRIWDETPKLSADGPHCFVPSRETLFQPVGPFHRLIVETAQYPVLKLTHKLDHANGVAGTAYRWMCNRMGV